MITNLSVTGFYGTGSGAVLDLLREYENVSIVPYGDIDYEHIPFYFNGGLFDLFTLLTNGNNMYSSDKVIHNFIKSMHILNDYDYLWFGSYNKLFGDEFISLCNEFVDSISKRRTGLTTNHIVRSRFSVLKAFAQICYHMIKGKKFNQYGIKYIFDSNVIYSAMPEYEKLCSAAQKFTSSYMKLFSAYSESEVNVFDHLIWSSQIDTFSCCFDENTKFIVVDRDPRDIYILDQYFWNPNKKKTGTHFPTDINEFVEEWEKTIVLPKCNPNALCIHFEDLIYNYECTVKRIEKFIGNDIHHTKPNTRLQIEKSIENTQVFLCKTEWMETAKLIGDRLSNFVYDFPYSRVPDITKTFSL